MSFTLFVEKELIGIYMQWSEQTRGYAGNARRLIRKRPETRTGTCKKIDLHGILRQVLTLFLQMYGFTVS